MIARMKGSKLLECAAEGMTKVLRKGAKRGNVGMNWNIRGEVPEGGTLWTVLVCIEAVPELETWMGGAWRGICHLQEAWALLT
jgi:hypothetical protein